MSVNILTLNLEASSGNGEDSHLICNDANSKFVVLGVFDGLGGRSAGFDGMTGGKIASGEAAQIAEIFLKQWNSGFNKDIVIELQSNICQALKSHADSKMGKSRLSGTLTGKRLCTTIALASIPKHDELVEDSFEISLAWMGDSRVYFLSPTSGLQQLTVDDLEIDKDAFQMIREDPRMSQYLTADIPDRWQINFATERLDEKGCILVCTDGCFQYLPTPWDFEKLLLETLTRAKTREDWKHLLGQEYEKIKQDDVSLVLYPVGFSDFAALSQAYQARLENIVVQYNTESSSSSLDELWESYRSSYEKKLKKALKSVVKENPEVSGNFPVENTDNKSKSENKNLDIQPERVACQEFSSENNVASEINEAANSSENLVNEAHHEDINSNHVKTFLETANAILKEALNNNLSQLQGMIVQCRKLLGKHPNNLEIIFFIGKVYFKLNQFQESIKYFEMVIHRKKEYYEDSLGFIAEAFYRIEDYSNSSTYFDRLKQRSYYNGFNDLHLDIYADSLFKTDRLEDSFRVCDAISHRNSNVPYADYLRGLIYDKYGKLENAKHFLKQSLIFYEREFTRIRSEHLQQYCDTVRTEYNKVCRKLEEQHQ